MSDRRLPFFLLTAAILLAGAIDDAVAEEPVAEAGKSDGSAQPVVDVPDKIWSEKVVVTATRSPREVGTLPLYTSVIDATEIELAPDSGTLDLLRELPSLNLSRDSTTLVAAPRDQAVSFRGLVGSVESRALPLVDGIPIVDPYGGWVNFGLVPKALIDRIEVVRGGGSSAWGNLALSGVINLITRSPSQREVGATVRLAERATRDLDLYYTGFGRHWTGWLAGTHFDTDGYIVVPEAERGPIDEPKYRRMTSLHGRLGYAASPSTSWTLRALYFDEHRGNGIPLDRNDEGELSLSLTFDRQSSGTASWQAQAFHRDIAFQDFAVDEADDRASVEPDSQIVSQPGFSTGLSGSWSASVGRHALTVGADWVEIRVNRRENIDWDGTQFTGRYTLSGRQRLGGVFVQDGLTVSPRTSLQLGARVDRVWSGDATSVKTSLATGELTGEDTITDEAKTAFDPSLGVVYAVGPRTRLRGAVYTGFRSGTPSELFLGSAGNGRSITVPNAGLEPERLLGAEAGVDFTPSRRATLRLTGFRNVVKDLLQRILVGTAGSGGGVVEPCGELLPRGRCFERQNVGKIRSTGIEIGAELRFAESWRLTLDATLMRSRIAENPNDPALVGNQVERAPDRQATAALEWNDGRIGRVLLRARYVSDAYDDAENEEYLPSHTLVDLSWSREVSRDWQLFAGVENLLDRRYISRWTSGNHEINGPRLVHVGVRFRAGAGR